MIHLSLSLFSYNAPPVNLTYLHSLATEAHYVREHLAAYGNDLIALGVDGFRLDAAKRMLLFIP